MKKKDLIKTLEDYAKLIQSDYTNHFFDDAIEESINEFLNKDCVKINTPTNRSDYRKKFKKEINCTDYKISFTDEYVYWLENERTIQIKRIKRYNNKIK
jgi:hypothetical protein